MKRYIGWGPEQRSFCPHGVWAWNAGMWKGSGSPTWKISEPTPFGFLWRLHYIGMIDKIIGHWWLIQSLAPLPSPEIREQNWKFQPSINGWFPWQPDPKPLVLSKSHLININSVVVERGLLWITRHPFQLYGSEAISETEDRKPNIIKKRMLPLLLSLRKFQGFGELWARNRGQTPNIYEKYILVIWVTKYIFLINHNISHSNLYCRICFGGSPNQDSSPQVFGWGPPCLLFFLPLSIPHISNCNSYPQI